MRDLAQETLGIVERWERGEVTRYEDSVRLRRLVSEARELLPDAGFPAESAWRGMQRASIGYETQLGRAEPGYWEDVRHDLEGALETLRMLVAPPAWSDSDFHLIG